MRKYTILDRITDVYNESVEISTNSNDKVKSTELSSIYKLPNYTYSHPEIEGNYLLFFNNIYNTLTRKYIKKVLKRIAWPVLKRQVFFNSTIRQVLYELVQVNHELSLKEEENKNYLYILDEKIEEIYLSMMKLERISELETNIEHLTQANQRLSEQVFLLTNKISCIPQIESELAQVVTRLKVAESLESQAFSSE